MVDLALRSEVRELPDRVVSPNGRRFQLLLFIFDLASMSQYYLCQLQIFGFMCFNVKDCKLL